MATWRYTFCSVLFFYLMIDGALLVALWDVVTKRPSVFTIVLFVLTLCTMVTQVISCTFLRKGLGAGLPTARVVGMLLAPSLVVWGMAFFHAEYALLAAQPLWLSIAPFVCLVSRSQRFALTAAAFVLTAAPVTVQGLLLDNELAWPTNFGFWVFLFYTLSMPLLLLTSVWWWLVVVRLDENRHIATELAIAEERLRFASDLHDIQGHHLQVIALKAELAERLLERDVSATKEHLHDVRITAKTALEETRALVAGLREVTLEDEIANAADVLELTGATCDLSISEVPMSVEVQRVLALSVREATTNIMRHSTASHIGIALHKRNGSVHLLVKNNGLEPSETRNTSPSQGTGISGLRHRLEAVGATVAVTEDLAGDRFSLEVVAPASRRGVLTS